MKIKPAIRKEVESLILSKPVAITLIKTSGCLLPKYINSSAHRLGSPYTKASAFN
jgi:hypothetical protein